MLCCCDVVVLLCCCVRMMMIMRMMMMMMLLLLLLLLLLCCALCVLHVCCTNFARLMWVCENTCPRTVSILFYLSSFRLYISFFFKKKKSLFSPICYILRAFYCVAKFESKPLRVNSCNGALSERGSFIPSNLLVLRFDKEIKVLQMNQSMNQSIDHSPSS